MLQYFLQKKPSTPAQKRKPTKPGQKGKKKKISLKFTIDCTHPVEDGIMNAGEFVSFDKVFIRHIS